MSKKKKTIIETTQEFDILEYMNGNEKIPQYSSKNWKKIKDVPYSTYENMEKTIYKIKKKDMKDIEKNINNIETNLKNIKKTNRTIIRIYTASLGKKKYVAYTTQTLSAMIKNQIYNHLKGKNVSFTDNFGKIVGIKIELNELLLLKQSNKLNKKFLQERKNMYQNKNMILIDKIIKYIEDIILNTELPLKKYKIFKAINIKTGAFFYFCDTIRNVKFTKSYISKLEKNSVCDNINNVSDFDINFVEEIKVKMPTISFLYTDRYITEYDTINNGLNKQYYIFEDLVDEDDKIMKTLIFTHLQRYIFQIKFKNKITEKKTNGYIYKIANKTNNKCYIGLSKKRKNFKNLVIEKYNTTINKLMIGDDLLEISKLLSTSQFKDLDFQILEQKTKINDFDLNIKANEYIKQCKSIKNGYNKKKYKNI